MKNITAEMIINCHPNLELITCSCQYGSMTNRDELSEKMVLCTQEGKKAYTEGKEIYFAAFSLNMKDHGPETEQHTVSFDDFIQLFSDKQNLTFDADCGFMHQFSLHKTEDNILEIPFVLIHDADFADLGEGALMNIYHIQIDNGMIKESSCLIGSISSNLKNPETNCLTNIEKNDIHYDPFLNVEPSDNAAPNSAILSAAIHQEFIDMNDGPADTVSYLSEDCYDSYLNGEICSVMMLELDMKNEGSDLPQLYCLGNREAIVQINDKKYTLSINPCMASPVTADEEGRFHLTIPLICKTGLEENETDLDDKEVSILVKEFMICNQLCGEQFDLSVQMKNKTTSIQKSNRVIFHHLH